MIAYQTQITQKDIDDLYSGVNTVEINNFVAKAAATMTTWHPDFIILATHITISNLKKETKKDFSGTF